MSSESFWGGSVSTGYIGRGRSGQPRRRQNSPGIEQRRAFRHLARRGRRVYEYTIRRQGGTGHGTATEIAAREERREVQDAKTKAATVWEGANRMRRRAPERSGLRHRPAPGDRRTATALHKGREHRPHAAMCPFLPRPNAQPPRKPNRAQQGARPLPRRACTCAAPTESVAESGA